MKILIMPILFFLMLPPVIALVYTDQEMIEILDDWKQSIDQVKYPYDEGEMKTLESALFKLGRPKEQYAKERSILFEKAQVKMLADPNHAKYFQDKIEQARAKLPEGVRRHSGIHNDFETLRCYIIRDTMSHIPSPEIVRALGEYLDDERDTPPPNNWLDLRSNAYLACSALEKIGLKNAPLPPTAGENPDNLATWKLWWGPIKAGNRTFSFVGQDVDYRFRKDGSYEALSRLPP